MRNWIILLAGLIVLTGCTRRVYEPVERVICHTDTVTHYINTTDSVTVIERVYESDSRYDSIAPILDSLNRVIGWDRYHFREVTKLSDREKERLMAVIDSLKAVSADSIQVPYPVERELTKWEQTKMDLGGMAMGGVAIAFCIAVAWLINKIRK